MEREAESFHLLVCSHLYQQDLDLSELWIRRNSQQTVMCASGGKRSRGTSPIIWKENGGENSMTQSTAAPMLCAWHAGGEAEGDRREMTLI